MPTRQTPPRIRTTPRAPRRSFAGAVFVAGLSGLLAACAGNGPNMADVLQGLGVKKAEPGAANGSPLAPGSAPTQAAGKNRPLIGSEIDGLLKKHPITNANRPETWPRVAITVVSAPPSIYKTNLYTSPVGAQDCATYNVKVWNSPSEGRSYDGLRLCYGELYTRMQRVPMYQVPTWAQRRFWPGERNTGSVRNDGPVPPADLFPVDPVIQTLWLDTTKTTLAFVAGPLYVLGYNWNDISDKRVWFVSLPGPN